jgi:hypothetical protein
VRRAAVLVGGVTALALVLLGVALLVYHDADKTEPARTERVLVDPAAGTFRGVRLGATRAEAVARLGEAPPWTDDDPVEPLEEDWTEIGAPSVMTFPGTPDVLRYPRTVVELEDGRVIAIVTAELGATTPPGVAVGDDLASVRAAYPALRCWDAPVAGGHGSYPVCSGRVESRRWLWFGEDPIRSITIASVRLG